MDKQRLKIESKTLDILEHWAIIKFVCRQEKFPIETKRLLYAAGDYPHMSGTTVYKLIEP